MERGFQGGAELFMKKLVVESCLDIFIFGQHNINLIAQGSPQERLVSVHIGAIVRGSQARAFHEKLGYDFFVICFFQKL